MAVFTVDDKQKTSNKQIGEYHEVLDATIYTLSYVLAFPTFEHRTTHGALCLKQIRKEDQNH